MIIYLVRHTTPAVEKGICYGQTDLPLKDTFETEAQEIRELVPALSEVPLYASPLQRCARLAEYLGGKTLTFDERIKEMHFGDWEMKPWSEIDREKLEYWMKNLDKASTPRGESNEELRQRSIHFWEEHLKKGYEQSALVTHFGVMQSLLSYLLDIPISRAFRLDLGYGAVVRVSIQQQQYYKIKFLR